MNIGNMKAGRVGMDRSLILIQPITKAKLAAGLRALMLKIIWIRRPAAWKPFPVQLLRQEDYENAGLDEPEVPTAWAFPLAARGKPPKYGEGEEESFTLKGP